jgi:hypothetical protein
VCQMRHGIPTVFQKGSDNVLFKDALVGGILFVDDIDVSICLDS